MALVFAKSKFGGTKALNRAIMQAVEETGLTNKGGRKVTVNFQAGRDLLGGVQREVEDIFRNAALRQGNSETWRGIADSVTSRIDSKNNSIIIEVHHPASRARDVGATSIAGKGKYSKGNAKFLAVPLNGGRRISTYGDRELKYRRPSGSRHGNLGKGLASGFGGTLGRELGDKNFNALFALYKQVITPAYHWVPDRGEIEVIVGEFLTTHVNGAR